MAAGGIEAGFSRISPSLDDAARTLGQTAGRRLWRIHLPMSRPAFATAAMLVFVDCMKELPATLLLRPLGFETLATEVWKYTSTGSYSQAALPALLRVVVAGPFVYFLMGRREPAPSD